MEKFQHLVRPCVSYSRSLSMLRFGRDRIIEYDVYE